MFTIYMRWLNIITEMDSIFRNLTANNEREADLLAARDL